MSGTNNTNTTIDPPERVTIFGCPAPDCSFASGGRAEMVHHINDAHQGEWNDPDWPDPEVDDERDE